MTMHVNDARKIFDECRFKIIEHYIGFIDTRIEREARSGKRILDVNFYLQELRTPVPQG